MTAPSEEQVRECARLAAEYLRVNGWHGTGVRKQGSAACCLVQATSEASTQLGGWRLVPGVDREVDARAMAIVYTADDPEITAIWQWNDRPGRTADEVIAVLERVAAGEGATDYLATPTI